MPQQWRARARLRVKPWNNLLRRWWAPHEARRGEILAAGRVRGQSRRGVQLLVGQSLTRFGRVFPTAHRLQAANVALQRAAVVGLQLEGLLIGHARLAEAADFLAAP